LSHGLGQNVPRGGTSRVPIMTDLFSSECADEEDGSAALLLNDIDER